MEESFQYSPEHEEELPSSSIETEVDRNVRYHRRLIVSQKSYEQCERETQTLYIDVKEMLFPRPDIRQGRNVADNVKDAIATISYRCITLVLPTKQHVRKDTVIGTIWQLMNKGNLSQT